MQLNFFFMYRTEEPQVDTSANAIPAAVVEQWEAAEQCSRRDAINALKAEGSWIEPGDTYEDALGGESCFGQQDAMYLNMGMIAKKLAVVH